MYLYLDLYFDLRSNLYVFVFGFVFVFAFEIQPVCMLSQLDKECEIELEVAGKLQKQLQGKYMNIEHSSKVKEWSRIQIDCGIGIGVTPDKIHRI